MKKKKLVEFESLTKHYWAEPKGIRIDDRMALIYKEIASVFWEKGTFW